MLVELIPKTKSAKSRLANLGKIWMFHSWSRHKYTCFNGSEAILFVLVSEDKPWNGIWVQKNDPDFNFILLQNKE